MVQCLLVYSWSCASVTIISFEHTHRRVQSLSISSELSIPRQPLIFFLYLRLCLFSVFHINGIMQHDFLISFSAWYFQVSSMLARSVIHSSLLSIIFYCMDVSSFFKKIFHQLMNQWIISTLCLLWIMLLQTFTHRALWRQMFSFLLDVSSGELLGHMVIPHLIFWGIGRLFSQVMYHFTFSSNSLWRVPISLFPHQHL